MNVCDLSQYFLMSQTNFPVLSALLTLWSCSSQEGLLHKEVSDFHPGGDRDERSSPGRLQCVLRLPQLQLGYANPLWKHELSWRFFVLNKYLISYFILPTFHSATHSNLQVSVRRGRRNHTDLCGLVDFWSDFIENKTLLYLRIKGSSKGGQ